MATKKQIELVGLAEAAELLGLSKAALCERRHRTHQPGDRLPPFPEPVAVLRCGSIWMREQIEAYAAEAARLAELSDWERRYGTADPIDLILGRIPDEGER
jgi:hypothetical protein